MILSSRGSARSLGKNREEANLSKITLISKLIFPRFQLAAATLLANRLLRKAHVRHFRKARSPAASGRASGLYGNQQALAQLPGSQRLSSGPRLHKDRAVTAQRSAVTRPSQLRGNCHPRRRCPGSSSGGLRDVQAGRGLDPQAILAAEGAAERRYTSRPAGANPGAAAFVHARVVAWHAWVVPASAARASAGASRKVWVAQLRASLKAWAGSAYTSYKG